MLSVSRTHKSGLHRSNVELNSNYAVLIFHYTCPPWLVRRAARRAALNNWTIMESGMAKACFLSRRMRRAIVTTVPSVSSSNALSSPPSPVTLFFGTQVSFTRDWARLQKHCACLRSLSCHLTISEWSIQIYTRVESFYTCNWKMKTLK